MTETCSPVSQPAVSVVHACGNPPRLRKRKEFEAAKKGARLHGRAFLLQAVERKPVAGIAETRFGFTVTKKCGNAVMRNRIRRRLREAVRLGERSAALPGHDYVLIGKSEALNVPFTAIVASLAESLDRINRFGANPHKPGTGTKGRKRTPR
ncbi:MAG: ribonuclease P protein component [Nitratireductor sp.]|nr:ribonuclease P protein component [Nitratireductor sp.]MCB1454747.1 ribonuclease P protein component [Nitratireductor sp.]